MIAKRHPDTDTTVNIEWRTRVCPQEARNAGWTKNHIAVEVLFFGKWRTMGYFTQKQIDAGKWIEPAKRRCTMNAGTYVGDRTIQFHPH